MDDIIKEHQRIDLLHPQAELITDREARYFRLGYNYAMRKNE